MQKNKSLAIAISILLIASMSASAMLLPSTSAHTPLWQIPTFAHIYAATDPIGVGQKASIYYVLPLPMPIQIDYQTTIDSITTSSSSQRPAAK